MKVSVRFVSYEVQQRFYKIIIYNNEVLYLYRDTKLSTILVRTLPRTELTTREIYRYIYIRFNTDYTTNTYNTYNTDYTNTNDNTDNTSYTDSTGSADNTDTCQMSKNRISDLQINRPIFG